MGEYEAALSFSLNYDIMAYPLIFYPFTCPQYLIFSLRDYLQVLAIIAGTAILSMSKKVSVNFSCSHTTYWIL